MSTRVAGLGKGDAIPTYTLEGQGLRITQALAQAGVTKGGGGQSIQLGTIWLPFGFEQKAGKASLGYVRISSSIRPTSAKLCKISSGPSKRNTTRTQRTSM